MAGTTDTQSTVQCINAAGCLRMATHCLNPEAVHFPSALEQHYLEGRREGASVLRCIVMYCLTA